MNKASQRRPDVDVVPFEREHQAAVQALILEGLEEHWGVLDPALNSDLDDIASSYSTGTVLVALCAERVAGVGAILPVAPDEGEVLRMSVASDLRRQGIATAILHELVAFARRQGWHSLRLETTASWRDAVQFYRSFGFVFSHFEEGRLGRDAFFRMDLRRSSSEQ